MSWPLLSLLPFHLTQEILSWTPAMVPGGPHAAPAAGLEEGAPRTTAKACPLLLAPSEWTWPGSQEQNIDLKSMFEMGLAATLRTALIAVDLSLARSAEKACHLAGGVSYFYFLLPISGRQDEPPASVHHWVLILRSHFSYGFEKAKGKRKGRGKELSKNLGFADPLEGSLCSWGPCSARQAAEVRAPHREVGAGSHPSALHPPWSRRGSSPKHLEVSSPPYFPGRLTSAARTGFSTLTGVRQTRKNA